MKTYVWSAFFFLLACEIFSLLPVRETSPALPSPAAPLFQRGIIHVHSDLSDGGGSVAEIAKAGRDAGMDFVVLTDHNTSRARQDGLEKSYAGTDIFVEMEASTPAGHALTFYSHTEARQLSDEAVNKLAWNHFLGTDTRPGLFIAIAHPSNLKNPWNRLDRSPDGIEVINFDSVWQQEVSDSLLDFAGTLLVLPFNPFLAALRFFQIYEKDFVAWDAMNGVTKGHFGILAHDTHAKLKFNQNLWFRWPDYGPTFRLAENIVFHSEPLPEDFESRKKIIYRSIRDGRLAMHFQSLYPYAGNDWRFSCGGQVLRPGDEGKVGAGRCVFEIETPALLPFPKLIRIWKDGELWQENPDTSAKVEVPVSAPGIYRVEVWLSPRSLTHLFMHENVPYVFYNPVYIK